MKIRKEERIMEKKMKGRRKEEMAEKCVLCGKPTPYLITTPVNEREGYVEGCGQVCGDCLKTL